MGEGRLRDRIFDSFFGLRFVGQSYIDIVYPYGDGPWTTSQPACTTGVTGTTTIAGKEVCMDATHPGPPFRQGGPFGLYRWATDEYTPKAPVSVQNALWKYEGSHIPSYSPKALLGISSVENYMSTTDDDEFSSYGATGWNRFRPTRSGAELGVFLGELREVPRMLRTTAKGFSDLWKSMGGNRSGFAPKSVANHWLNTQFGWFPFLSDLRSFYKVTKNLDQRVKQLKRDNGRWIRRGGTVAVEHDEEVVLDSPTTCGLWPQPSTHLFSGTPYGSRHAVKSYDRNVWFEGSFRYWVPENLGPFSWNAKAVAMLYGLQPSPSLLWELTPWSWLIDWCTNAGDVIDNLSSMALDNLCARYAYVMAHTVNKVVYSGQNNYLTGPAQATWTAYAECKGRIGASPFGFGLTGADFSARQWSILGALGLSRSKSAY